LGWPNWDSRIGSWNLMSNREVLLDGKIAYSKMIDGLHCCFFDFEGIDSTYINLANEA
jgi:hypothetical protein